MSESRRDIFIRLLKNKSDLDIVEITHDAVRELIEVLEEPERTGHWISEVKGKKAIIDEFGIVSCSAHCSECGDWLTASDEYGCRGRFCPNCGAKMGDEHDDS